MSLLRNDFPHNGAVALLFDQPVASLAEMRQAIALLTTLAAGRLQRDKLLAQKVVVWMERMDGPETLPRITTQILELPVPIASLGVLAAFTHDAAHDLYRPGGRYRQAGVYCEDLSPDYSGPVSRLHDRIDRAAHRDGIIARAGHNLDKYLTRIVPGEASSRYASILGTEVLPWAS